MDHDDLTSEIRFEYATNAFHPDGMAAQGEQFDAWLREVKRRAWDEGAAVGQARAFRQVEASESGEDDIPQPKNPYQEA